jgi:hypothetical protein
MKYSAHVFCSIVIISLFIHNAKAEYNQHFNRFDCSAIPQNEHELLRLFCSPVRFTQEGITFYLKHVYSHPAYGHAFLPHSLSDLIEFLAHGKYTHQNRLYMQSAFRLFNNKVKSAPFVTAYAFSDMLDKLPQYVQEYCVATPEESSVSSVVTSIKKTLYSMFLSSFSYFKTNPDAFFDDLSVELIKAIGGARIVQEHVEQEQLRQTMLRFLELCLNKMIWSPLDQENSWQSVKVIAQELAQLADQGIISHDELEDLYQSLLESFCHFLELTGSDLSSEVIDQIKEDIASDSLLLFTLEEQEDHIETKHMRMMRALKDTEAKIHGRRFGMITEPFFN